MKRRSPTTGVPTDAAFRRVAGAAAGLALLLLATAPVAAEPAIPPPSGTLVDTVGVVDARWTHAI
jgi:hypothetical protein